MTGGFFDEIIDTLSEWKEERNEKRYNEEIARIEERMQRWNKEFYIESYNRLVGHYNNFQEKLSDTDSYFEKLEDDLLNIEKSLQSTKAYKKSKAEKALTELKKEMVAPLEEKKDKLQEVFYLISEYLDEEVDKMDVLSLDEYQKTSEEVGKRIDILEDVIKGIEEKDLINAPIKEVEKTLKEIKKQLKELD